MPANAQALLDSFTASTAILGRVGGWHGCHSTASVHCFDFEDGAHLRPTSIRYGCAWRAVLYQVGHPQVFETDRVVDPQQQHCGRVAKLPTLTADFLARASKQP